MGGLRLKIPAQLCQDVLGTHLRMPVVVPGTGVILKDCRRFSGTRGEAAGVSAWSRQVQGRRVCKIRSVLGQFASLGSRP